MKEEREEEKENKEEEREKKRREKRMKEEREEDERGNPLSSSKILSHPLKIPGGQDYLKISDNPGHLKLKNNLI